MEGSYDIGARQYFEKADFFMPELLLKKNVHLDALHLCMRHFSVK